MAAGDKKYWDMPVDIAADPGQQLGSAGIREVPVDHQQVEGFAS